MNNLAFTTQPSGKLQHSAPVLRTMIQEKEQIRPINSRPYTLRNYGRFLKAESILQLLEDLKSFMLLDKMGIQHATYYAASFGKERTKNQKDFPLRAWLHLTRLKQMNKEFDTVSLKRGTEENQFILTISEHVFMVKLVNPISTGVYDYPILIFKPISK